MKVKIRLGHGPRVRREGTRNQRLSLATAALLTPFSLMAFALGTWRLAADLNWTKQFAISQGVFSHWQVWFAMAFILQAAAVMLNRYGAPSAE